MTVCLFIYVRTSCWGLHAGSVLGSALGLKSSSLYSSGFSDVNFTSAAAIGGCGDDVLGGGLLIGRLLLQMFSVRLSCVLRNRLFGLQLSLTLRDNVVCLQDKDENIFSSTIKGSVLSISHHVQFRMYAHLLSFTV